MQNRLPIQLNDVQIFVHVLQAQSFTRAAQILEMPKSTVSERISRLEKAMGVRLIDRSTRSMKPTREGRRYFEQCAPIVAELCEINTQMGEAQKQPRGKIRIAAPLLFAHTFLGNFVCDFLSKYSQVEIELVATDKPVNVIQEEFDLVIHAAHKITPGLVARKIGESQRICCASPGYIKTHGSPQTPAELSQHACLVSSANSPNVWRFHKRHSKDEKSHRVQVGGRYVVNSLQLIVSAAMRGAGIAMLPSFCCEEQLQSGALVRVLSDYDSQEHSDLHVVYLSRKHLPTRVKIFTEELIKSFKMLPRWGIDEDGVGVWIQERAGRA